MSTIMEKVRKEYRFTGRVQGVGFRYHASHTAQLLGITGWVQNCYDGSVKAQAQGHRQALRDFIEMLHGGRYIEITGVEEREIPVDEGERGFRILY